MNISFVMKIMLSGAVTSFILAIIFGLISNETSNRRIEKIATNVVIIALVLFLPFIIGIFLTWLWGW